MRKLGNYTSSVKAGKTRRYGRQKAYKPGLAFPAAKSRLGTKGVARKAKGY